VPADGHPDGRGWASAAHAEGREHGAVTQHRVAGLAVEQSDLAPEAEPAPRPALAAGVAAKLAPLDPERHRALQRLDRLDRPAVAEVDVAPGARAILPGPGAAVRDQDDVPGIVALGDRD